MLMAADLTRALDPSQLMRDSGLEPDPWQEQLLREHPRRCLMLCSRQSGKTEVAITLAEHTALYQPNSLVLIVSPSLRQSSETFRRLKLLHASLTDVPAFAAESALRAQYGNGSRCLALPGAAATLRGYARANLVIVDEAARVSDEVLTAIRPTMAVASNATLIALTTPAGKRGWFYEAWSGGDETWHRVRVPATECPRLTPQFLAEEKRALGPEQYRQEYALEFLDDDQAVFGVELVDRAFTAEVVPLWA